MEISGAIGRPPPVASDVMTPIEDFEDLAVAMYECGRFCDASDAADGASSSYGAGEYFYAVVDMVEFAADHGVPLGEFRQYIEPLIIPLVDEDEVAEFRGYLSRVPLG